MHKLQLKFTKHLYEYLCSVDRGKENLFLGTSELFVWTSLHLYVQSDLSKCASSTHYTIRILGTGADRSEQIVQTQIRLLLKDQSDQGLHCLPVHVQLLDTLLH